MIKFANNLIGNRVDLKYYERYLVHNATTEVKGKIVGLNMKKTLLRPNSFITEKSHESYGLFVHVKNEAGDQYTFIFDPFEINCNFGSRLYIKNGIEKISLWSRVKWKALNNMMRAAEYEKRSRGSKSMKNRRYHNIVKYQPTIMRLMEVCGVTESVDIIGSEIIFSDVTPVSAKFSDCTPSPVKHVPLNMTMYIKSATDKDSNIVMCPYVYYIETENKDINDMMDMIKMAAPHKVIKNYGNE